MTTSAFNLRSVIVMMGFILFGFTTVYAQFAGGTGTETDPYQVATAEHLNNVRSYPAAFFIQMGDIDLGVAPYNEGEGWEPIGTFISPTNAGNVDFTGRFDGNNHAIQNLYINRPAADGQGLFCFTRFCDLINIQLTNVNVHGNMYIGGLVGYSGSNSNYDLCRVQGTVIGETMNVGGLLGYSNSNWYISRCVADVNVTGQSNVGGLVGNVQMSSEINTSYAKGVVQSSNFNAGGLVGLLSYSNLKNSYSRAEVQGMNKVGGLVGYCEDVTILNCYSTGLVFAGGSNIGGLIGLSGFGGAGENSYWNIETSEYTTSDGGLGRTTDEMTFPYDNNTYVGWNFDSMWSADSDGTINAGYPYLTTNIVPNSDNLQNPKPGVFVSNYPNPFMQNTNILLKLSKASQVTMSIYNLKGELVRTLYTGRITSENQVFSWDGKNNQSKNCPAGMYLLKTTNEHSSITTKMLMLK